jgi:hypothetical protein
LPIEETAASLSAILLDEAYYAFLRDNVPNVGGLPLLSEAGPIPFKARAFLDLSQRKAAGANSSSAALSRSQTRTNASVWVSIERT